MGWEDAPETNADYGATFRDQGNYGVPLIPNSITIKIKNKLILLRYYSMQAMHSQSFIIFVNLSLPSNSDCKAPLMSCHLRSEQRTLANK